MPRPRRQSLITNFLRKGPVASQHEIVRALREAGEDATQATISRDLSALGVVKTPAGYSLPESLGVAGSGLEHAESEMAGELDLSVRRHVVAVRQADSLVVLKTMPGHAGIVGAALDRYPPRGCVGTVAGDDTIFVATTGRTAAQRVSHKLTAVMEAARVSKA